MKCEKCGHENLLKAQYCSSCGNRFTDEERQAAFDETIYGKFDKLIEVKEWITLSKITDNKFFRIAVLVMIIIAGLLTGGNKGSSMMILESDDYTVRYNSNLEEYYVFTDKNEVDVDLYLPGKPEGLVVTGMTLDGKVLDQKEYALGDKVTLIKSDNVLYHVSGEYEKAEKSIDLIVYDLAVLP